MSIEKLSNRFKKNDYISYKFLRPYRINEFKFVVGDIIYVKHEWLNVTESFFYLSFVPSKDYSDNLKRSFPLARIDNYANNKQIDLKMDELPKEVRMFMPVEII